MKPRRILPLLLCAAAPLAAQTIHGHVGAHRDTRLGEPLGDPFREEALVEISPADAKPREMKEPGKSPPGENPLEERRNRRLSAAVTGPLNAPTNIPADFAPGLLPNP